MHILEILVTYISVIIPILIFLFIIWNAFANAGSGQYITLERRWIGKHMADGRTVALSGEIGLQAKILGPGLHFFIPFINKATKQSQVKTYQLVNSLEHLLIVKIIRMVRRF